MFKFIKNIFGYFKDPDFVGDTTLNLSNSQPHQEPSINAKTPQDHHCIRLHQEISGGAKNDIRKNEVLNASDPIESMMLLYIISQDEYDAIKLKNNYIDINVCKLYDDIKTLANNFSNNIITQQEYLDKRKELIKNL